MLLCASGCGGNERKAAQRIDFTFEATRQASNLFATDPQLRSLPIVVDGFKGDMRLKGQVQTPDQKLRAEKLLWSVRGVRSVKNDLDVIPLRAQ